MPALGKPRLPVYSNGTLEESIANRMRGLHVSTVQEERRPMVYMPVKKVRAVAGAEPWSRACRGCSLPRWMLHGWVACCLEYSAAQPHS